ncbi:MAG: hypothetical protein Q4D14_01320 [Bacteroidales bacterium]|nr:hypothetical protein [Bacteroidales bacterium]
MKLNHSKIKSFAIVVAVVVMTAIVGCTKRSSIDFDVYTVEHVVENDSVRFNLEVSVDFPKPNCTGEAVDSIRLFLVRTMFGMNQLEEPNALLQRYRDTVFANYCAEMREFRRVAGFTDAFVEEVVGNANVLNDTLLSYDHAVYLYYGGSQGQRRFNSYVFNLSTGARLTESDLFRDEEMTSLSALLTQTLTELVEKTVDSVMPNGNFAVEEEGIRYRYDSYELNTFEIPAVESIDLMLPTEKVLPIMRTNSIVYHYLSTVTTAKE